MQRGVTASANVVYLTTSEKENAERECRVVDTTGPLRVYIPRQKQPTANNG